MTPANDNAPCSKICTKCRKLLNISEFHRDRNRKDGRMAQCKHCSRAEKRKYREDNAELVRAQGRAQYAANREGRRNSHKRWVDANPDKFRAAKARCRQTPKARLENNVRGYIHKTITKGYKSKPTFEALGYTSAELMSHLEKLFQPGMTWENYGEWHIDHIIPLSAFNYQTTDDWDFKRAWSLSNLQPLWAADNIRKHAKLSSPFQPSLAFGEPANDNDRGEDEDAA